MTTYEVVEEFMADPEVKQFAKQWATTQLVWDHKESVLVGANKELMENLSAVLMRAKIRRIRLHEDVANFCAAEI